MKYIVILIIVLYCSVNTFAQLNPQSKQITQKFFPEIETLENTTPALQKNKGFTDYDDLMLFLNNLVEQHPENIKLNFIGKSQKGYQIPLVLLATQNTKEKIKVWMQGGLHGNEPASTEGMLYLLDKLLNDSKYTYLLDDIDLAIVPMANIDGYLKQDRYAANGLDLNRDQTKLMAPESVSLKQAFSDFNPEIGLDFHEYRPYRKDFTQLSDFGITSLFDAMFLYSGNLNVPENIRTLTDTLFVENARRILDKNELKHHDYISTGKYGGEIHFNQGSTNARSSATNYALTNTISTLFEIRGVGIGRTSFKRRINTTFLIAVSYLETASANITLVKNEINKAINQQNDVVVTSKKTIEKGTLEIIDLDTNKIIELDVTIRDGLRSQANLIRERPLAYLVDANQTEIIEKLKTLGVTIETLTEDQEVEVETYKISEYERDSKKYEKMNLQTVETIIETKNIQFPKGTYKININQRRANIILEVLEPEAPNSFVSFGVLETEKEAYLPIYRITN
ncbi:M14 family metallocarboxypeptidase [Lacinutrix sp.]|uniref:M14 family metallopeptidase n=2 Tax=Lacinutrix sp. TaxID=1937692 RepID=UPI00262832BD|nr:M14 family metallocarboxypeptidase [Lacinutrix sp.]MDG1714792.1 M14 family metallocarboxypeptidase [Lacinutrix sp.]